MYLFTRSINLPINMNIYIYPCIYVLFLHISIGLYKFLSIHQIIRTVYLCIRLVNMARCLYRFLKLN